MDTINKSLSTETCHLCGHPAPQTLLRVHKDCADIENAGLTINPALATETCHLCGQPSFPFENQVHSECAAYENFLASL
jgi:ribosomal protein L37E